MNKFRELSREKKRRTLFFIFWLLAGISMVIIGISALLNKEKTINAASDFLGICSIITGIVTIFIRLYQLRTQGKYLFSLDGLIWITAGILFLNTGILSRLGRLVYIIGGILIIIEGIRTAIAAIKAREERSWLIPRIICSVILTATGIVFITNAEKIFRSLTVLFIGIYFIVHGVNIISDCIGRAKYLHNFRNLED